MLRIEHRHVVVEDVALDDGSEIGASAARYAISRARNDALIRLLVVVEASQIGGKLTVLNLTRRLILEHEQVLMKVLTIGLLRRRRFHAALEHPHQLSGLCHVGLLLITG